jgi:hypothetical protein
MISSSSCSLTASLVFALDEAWYSRGIVSVLVVSLGPGRDALLLEDFHNYHWTHAIVYAASVE